MEATLALGSNLGDRMANLERAVSLLEECLDASAFRTEALETEAVGFDGPPFLNMLVRIDVNLSPEDLLAVCKACERKMGRADAPEYDSDGRRIYRDRVIDIDILYYGDLVMATENLVIPHPQVRTRAYVKKLLNLQFVENKKHKIS